ncbi:hypothetical protein FGG78_41895 [Thioclava sp. BHET1]|nr:hypothetical protein FGG78_41895 [Thioclava sp. BHET1]
MLFPTGVMGVFYDPGVFHRDVARVDLFQRLCPFADDVWLYWMHRMTGSVPRLIACKHRVFEWPEGQDRNLRSSNVGGAGNDAAIANMIEYYGWPK